MNTRRRAAGFTFDVVVSGGRKRCARFKFDGMDKPAQLVKMSEGSASSSSAVAIGNSCVLLFVQCRPLLTIREKPSSKQHFPLTARE